MLVEVGEGLDRLPSLTVLHMENNRIESIHESFGRCRALTKLDLSSNNLRQLPSSMSKLRKLQRLGCANNMLRRIPSSMGQMKILKEFDLRYRRPLYQAARCITIAGCCTLHGHLHWLCTSSEA